MQKPSSLNISIAISGFFRACSHEGLRRLQREIIEPNERLGHSVELHGVTWDISGERLYRAHAEVDPRYDETEYWTGHTQPR